MDPSWPSRVNFASGQIAVSRWSRWNGILFLEKRRKGWKIYERVGELVWDRSMSPCQGYDARLDRKRSDERRNRVEVFWLLARLEILLLLLLLEAIESEGFYRSRYTEMSDAYNSLRNSIFELTVKRNIMQYYLSMIDFLMLIIFFFLIE